MSRYYEEMDEQYEERPTLWARVRSWVGLNARSTTTRSRCRTRERCALPPRAGVPHQHPQGDSEHRGCPRRRRWTQEGIQQILNLAATPPGVRERVVDFLNGVVYAIEGSVERVSEHVFVYAPPQAIIDAPNTTRTRTESE
jgi:hypothetical protein